ncbi:MAG TPA: hypothetical protein VEW69_07125 [Alphaproteobacteria bacterium]|nr:hypothetical protein [Alphaproteobacteria bacterium]
MTKVSVVALVALTLGSSGLYAQEHDHPISEKLGKVSFTTTCDAKVQDAFNRAMALLHSFTYQLAAAAFQEVASKDPDCAVAHWGIAMSYYHQLWEPPLPGDAVQKGKAELDLASQLKKISPREQEYIAAAGNVFGDPAVPYPVRAGKYREAMAALAKKYPQDDEAQIYYALALLSTASPQDKTHQNQKAAAQILEPLYAKYPQHPGLAHYLIHAYDNAELAAQGEKAAREYALIAPSAPHALHMPSHIFTRLGLWSDSVRLNQASRAAAHQQGDFGEEMHAMDYMVYASLQLDRVADVAALLQELQTMGSFKGRETKAHYAATAMPIRYAVERKQWKEAAHCSATEGAPPHVVALAAWARALGHARAGEAEQAKAELEVMEKMAEQLRAAGNLYWSNQVQIQLAEANAWILWAGHKPIEALGVLRSAADSEDAVEKLPVTPGPVVPAREQLGDMLLLAGQPAAALAEYEQSLKDSPGRRGSLQGALKSSRDAGLASKAAFYETRLQNPD